MSVFLSNETGLVVFTYTDICLSVGDSILFNDIEYYVIKKRLNVDNKIIEYFIDINNKRG